MELKEYPTLWQSKMMWAALSAFFVVMLITIACSLAWIAANLIGFIQPLLIPAVLALVLASPLERRRARSNVSRASSCLFVGCSHGIGLGRACGTHFRRAPARQRVGLKTSAPPLATTAVSQ